MKGSPEQIRKRLERRAASAPKVTAVALQETANKADSAATDATPRDTGAAKRGWRTKAARTGYILTNDRDRARYLLGGKLIAIGRKAITDTISGNRRNIAKRIKEG